MNCVQRTLCAAVTPGSLILFLLWFTFLEFSPLALSPTGPVLGPLDLPADLRLLEVGGDNYLLLLHMFLLPFYKWSSAILLQIRGIPRTL